MKNINNGFSDVNLDASSRILKQFICGLFLCVCACPKR